MELMESEAGNACEMWWMLGMSETGEASDKRKKREEA